MNSVVHPSVEPTLLKMKDNLPQGLLLTGVQGVGLLTIARELAGKNISTILAPVDTDGEPDATYGSISVEEVRRLYDSMQTRSSRARVVIIDDINRMTRQAQNAFLKLLEEPPASVRFIATAHMTDTILPTIRSRMQTVSLPQTTAEQDAQILDTPEYSPTEIKQIQFIAAGKPAELWRLTRDRAYFESVRDHYARARDFMSASTYQRILTVSSITNRGEALQFIDSVSIVIRAALRTSPRVELVNILERLLRARERILWNGNIKLWLLYIVL